MTTEIQKDIVNLPTTSGDVDTPLSPVEVINQVQVVQSIMKQVMKPGIDYDFPFKNAPKPALLKPGAEKLLFTFRIAPSFEVQDLSGDGHATFRIITKLTHISGKVLGYGVGQCSSREEKYLWQKTYIEEEYADAPADSKRKKYSKKNGKTDFSLQIKTDPHDKANTVLKMSKKRSLVDAILTCLAASDIFEQDTEREPGERTLEKKSVQMPQANSPNSPEQPQPVQQNGNVISEAQGKRLYAIFKQSGKTDQEMKNHLIENYDIDDSRQIPREHYDAICSWAEGKESTGATANV